MKQSNTGFIGSIETPLGFLEVRASDKGVTFVGFVEALSPSQVNGIVEDALRQLEEYFAGKRRDFDIPLDATGTGFQKDVWRTLVEVPYGETVSYQWIAEQLNNPKAVRAVGAANGKNPIAIVVPCHRIIGKNGTLTGYAGGLDRKAWLLSHEQGTPRQSPLL